MNIIKEYVQYFRDNPNRYWFKAKLYGWGWDPATKEGWLVVFLYILGVTLFGFTINATSPPQEIVFTFILPTILLTITLIRICYKKGEKPRWQWGPKDSHKDNKE